MRSKVKPGSTGSSEMRWRRPRPAGGAQRPRSQAAITGSSVAVAAAIASVIIAVVIALAVSATDWGEVGERVRIATDDMSALLFEDFVFPFEIVSVLLLAAVIGGVFLAKREPGGPS